jgi:hypothetical protein
MVVGFKYGVSNLLKKHIQCPDEVRIKIKGTAPLRLQMIAVPFVIDIADTMVFLP